MGLTPKRRVHQRFARGAEIALITIGTVTLLVPGVGAQQQPANNVATQAPDLTMRNLSRVAASAAEIKAVLVEDTGLMVEVKRWIAKDATAHGQIVSDKDLSADAIFTRLETDIQFRSVVTTLVQQYGYLVPKLNPESDLAKEHLLLVQERTKWIAETQEEERVQARQRSAAAEAAAQNAGGQSQGASRCDSSNNSGCSGTQNGSPASDRQFPVENSPSMTSPGNLRNAPASGGDTRTQLTEMQEMQDGSSQFLPLSGSNDGLLEASYGYGSPP